MDKTWFVKVVENKGNIRIFHRSTLQDAEDTKRIWLGERSVNRVLIFEAYCISKSETK